MISGSSVYTVKGQKGPVPERPIPKRPTFKGYQKSPLLVTRKAHLLISYQKGPQIGFFIIME